MPSRQFWVLARMPLAIERKGPHPPPRRSFPVFTQPEVAGDKGLGHVFGRGLCSRSPLREAQAAARLQRWAVQKPTDSSSPITYLLDLPEDDVDEPRLIRGRRMSQTRRPLQAPV